MISLRALRCSSLHIALLLKEDRLCFIPVTAVSHLGVNVSFIFEGADLEVIFLTTTFRAKCWMKSVARRMVK
jgi:hypothetical protein